MSELFYKKGNDLLLKLKIQTNSVSSNKDIQVSKNFSAVLPLKSQKLIVIQKNRILGGNYEKSKRNRIFKIRKND